VLAIDFDRNGKLEQATEVLPLTKMILVNGGFYSVEPVPEGSAIRLAEATPELGTLDVGTGYAQLAVQSEGFYGRLTGSEGKWQLPTGRYKVVSLGLGGKDDQGASWEVRSKSRSGGLRDFDIRQGQSLTVKLGPPLVAKTEVRQSGSRASIGLKIVGQGGEEYYAGARVNGRTVSEPRFKILDESEKVIASGAFSYG